MYGDLIKMADKDRWSIASRVEQLKNLPPVGGHYVNWLKSLKLFMVYVLANYAYSWAYEDIGATAWMNDIVPHAGTIFAIWAIVGITMLVNYASIADHMPTRFYYLATAPLVLYGFIAIFSVFAGDVSYIAAAAHSGIGGFTAFTIMFYTATISQYARETLENQAVTVKLNSLQAENNELKGQLVLREGDSDVPATASPTD